jgi:tetratricopeptide (TPR) repeat protein
MRIGKNTPWLVKTSSGKVMGPFFDKDLINRLRTREISLIDEIARPCGRWIYVRDEPALASVAEEVRQKNGRQDDDTTRAEMTLTPTHTVSLTDNLNEAHLDDRTEEIKNVTYIEPVREVIHKTGSSSITGETFVFEGDQVVRQQVGASAKWLWAATAIVLFAAIGFVVFRQFVAKPIQIRSIAKLGLAEAEVAFKVGDYDRALTLYKRGYDADPKEDKTFLPYSLLSIQLEKQSVLPRRLLETLLNTQERNREKILTAQALAYLTEGKFAEAEARLTRALDVDPMFRAATINLGALNIEKQDFEAANNHLELAVKDGSRDGIEFLLLAKALVALYEKEKDKAFLGVADQYLSQYLVSKQDYVQEALVASIYVDHLRGEKSKIMTKIDRFLETDPFQTDLHRHDLYIFRRGVTWDILNQWCLKSTENLDPVARLVAFEALCILKSENLRDANNKISDAVQQAPRDPLVQAAYGHILEASNNAEKAKAAYAFALDSNREKTAQLPRLLMARICEGAADFNCANIYWKELIQINGQSLAGLAGLAADAMRRNKDEARVYVRKGLAISPTYKPLLALQAEL